MAVFTPGLAERICGSGRTLPRERFLARLRRAGEDELPVWTLLDCIRQYFLEERWELMDALLDRAEELHGGDRELDCLRVKMLWCRGDREAALNLARGKMAAGPVARDEVPEMQELLEAMEATAFTRAMEQEWRQRENPRREPGRWLVNVRLYLYGGDLDPWKAATAMAVTDWEGGFRGMIHHFPKRLHRERQSGVWLVESPEEGTGAASQIQALLVETGWPFPPPWRWPVRWNEIGDVESVRMDVFATGQVFSGSTACVDGWFDSGQLAVLGELGAELMLSRYPE